MCANANARVCACMKAEIWKGEVIFVRNNFRRAVFVAFVAVVDVVVVVVVVDNVRGALNSRTRSTALALFSRAASPPLPLCPSAAVRKVLHKSAVPLSFVSHSHSLNALDNCAGAVSGGGGGGQSVIGLCRVCECDGVRALMSIELQITQACDRSSGATLR